MAHQIGARRLLFLAIMATLVGTYESWLSPSHGYHPTFKTIATLEDASLQVECTLNLHFLLPPTVFADRYELQNYAPRLQFAYRGPSNLELPVFALDVADRPELLVSVALNGEGREAPIEVDVPLHLRYGHVAGSGASDTHEDVFFPYPSAFLTCPNPEGHAEESTSAQAIKLRSYPLVSELTNSTATSILPLLTTNTHKGEVARLPLGLSTDAPVVEFGTSFVITLTFIYLLVKSTKAFTRLHSRP